MQITRTETPTGGLNRTRREEIVPLNTGSREVEPEFYLDSSESEGWPWDSDPSRNTWDIQVPAMRGVLVPFEQLDSQAADEQAGGSDEEGGVFAYGFSNRYQMFGSEPDDGDLNSSNVDRKLADYIAKYFDREGKPRGGTEIMEAIKAADRRYMGEFRKDDRDERPVRARVVFTDGALRDADAFRRYLAQATLDKDTGYGSHGDWDEVWAIAIIGPAEGGGTEAHRQYQDLAADHPWIHSYNFEAVVNPDEIAEDIAVAVVPTQA